MSGGTHDALYGVMNKSIKIETPDGIWIIWLDDSDGQWYARRESSGHISATNTSLAGIMEWLSEIILNTCY